jgi:hypothetical protein
MKRMAKLALAFCVGLVLISGMGSPSSARSAHTNPRGRHHEMNHNGSVWSYYPAYKDHAQAALPNARWDRSPEWNGPGTHYYQGSDNGSVWSYYPGYKPME